MQTIICKHDDRGGFEVLGTDGQPVRIILVEDDHMDAANITVNGDRHLIAIRRLKNGINMKVDFFA